MNTTFPASSNNFGFHPPDDHHFPHFHQQFRLSPSFEHHDPPSTYQKATPKSLGAAQKPVFFISIKAHQIAQVRLLRLLLLLLKD